MTKAQKADRAADRKAKRSGYERGSRSYIMSQIRGKDTSIETLTRSYLFRRGLRFRKNDRRYPGHPDIVLPKYRTMVFINGCFWHMHGCASSSVPKSNVEFWTAKLTRNRDRDARQHAELEAQGWRVIVVWECELKTVAAREKRLRRLYDEIVAPLPSREEAPGHARENASEGLAAPARPDYSDSGAA
ncbi:very short patch repair endonuclease [Pseudoscardovia radai]|uniref:very short patch repair endonuclease n=1 Tax=Pseudoscardovia radai TaxID=987066 RepID=UPI0039958AB0